MHYTSGTVGTALMADMNPNSLEMLSLVVVTKTQDSQGHDKTVQNSTEEVSYLASYTPPGSTDTYQSVYLLNPGKSVEIHFPANTIKYKVIECGVNLEVYDSVKINGEEKRTQPAGSTDRAAYDSG